MSYLPLPDQRDGSLGRNCPPGPTIGTSDTQDLLECDFLVTPLGLER